MQVKVADSSPTGTKKGDMARSDAESRNSGRQHLVERVMQHARGSPELRTQSFKERRWTVDQKNTMDVVCGTDMYPVSEVNLGAVARKTN